MLVILAMSWQKMRSFLPTVLRRRYWWAVLASFVVVASLISFTPSFAVGETVGNWLINGLSWIMLAIANLCIGLSIFFLRFFIAIASYNNYIDVDVVQLGWVMVRDVANMFFVVALLVIAFGTILGLEEYEWKKNLVKLILAAIFINFSNLIAQLFIDVAHVFTMTFLNAISATAGGNLISMFKLNEITSMVGVTPGDNSEFNTEIFLGAAVAALFAILAAVSMGAYVVVMMARVVVLWALIILSPLAYILGVLPKTKSYAERWWSEFTNHVIVAPIMVFFLWLAFATLGAGNIMTDIQADIPPGNRLATEPVKLQGSSFAPSTDPNRLSLSKVSTWENMSNFLIAIAFLYVGVKTSQETGAFGSGMIGDAWSFGKKVATIATGYAAGRWLVGKGQEGGMWGLKKVGHGIPLVGGRAFSNYGNAFKVSMGKKAFTLNKWAQDLEAPSDKRRNELKRLKDEHAAGNLGDAEYEAAKTKVKTETGGFFSRTAKLVASRMIETSGRADKRAEDWSKAAEHQKTIVEESYSTSKSKGGMAKLELGVKAHKAEEMASEKKAQKYAQMERRLFENKDSIFKGLEDKIFQAKAEGERDKDYNSRIGAAHLEVERAKAGVYAQKAESEEGKRVLDRQSEIAVARARDQVLREQQRTPRYEEAAKAKHMKEDIELASAGSDYDRTMAKIAYTRSEISGLQGNLARTPADNERLNGLLREMTSLQAVSVSRGPIFAGGAEGRALNGLALSPVNADNVVAEQARELTKLLQENVVATERGVEDAMDELRARMGAGFGAFMQTYTAGLADSADKGMVNKAGLFKEDYDAATGTTNFRAIKTSGGPASDDVKWSNGKRDWAVSQSSYSSIDGFNGAVDSKIVRGEAKASIDTAEARKRVAQIFGSVRENVVNSVKINSIGTFNEAFEQMQGADIQLLINEMRKNATDDQGIRALLARTNLKSHRDFAALAIQDKAGAWTALA